MLGLGAPRVHRSQETRAICRPSKNRTRSAGRSDSHLCRWWTDRSARVDPTNAPPPVSSRREAVSRAGVAHQREADPTLAALHRHLPTTPPARYPRFGLATNGCAAALLPPRSERNRTPSSPTRLAGLLGRQLDTFPS